MKKITQDNKRFISHNKKLHANLFVTILPNHRKLFYLRQSQCQLLNQDTYEPLLINLYIIYNNRYSNSKLSFYTTKFMYYQSRYGLQSSAAHIKFITSLTIFRLIQLIANPINPCLKLLKLQIFRKHRHKSSKQLNQVDFTPFITEIYPSFLQLKTSLKQTLLSFAFIKSKAYPLSCQK
eukprot:TRINITY_DN1570_c0_g1_i5.p1 TRINITY_DN1570_c0_g1~~TRINITY_DN1570_c0_g1_i5.p1  ORF type:complete len:189 (-),score=-14.14 TRINITY_DN1570_c0_g1_i5:148-684(-)